MVRERLDPIEEILDDAPGCGWVVFGDEVQEFRDPIQSRIRPDDAVAHSE